MLIPPLMIRTFVFFPTSVSFIAMMILLVAGIMEFRQGHIGRIAIAANAFLLWQIFFNVWDKLPNYVQFYLDLGTIVADVAILSYLFKTKPPTEFYQICYVAYGSFSVLLVIFFAFQFGLIF